MASVTTLGGNMIKVTNKDIEKAWEDFNSFDRCNKGVCPKPTRTFDVGESVKIGNLDDCVIVDVLPEYNGKIYRTDYQLSYDRDALRKFKMNGQEPPVRRATRYDWWYKIHKTECFDKDAPEMFAEYLPGQIRTIDISSLVYKMAHDGIVCDPRYQRGFVWDEENQVALIDSIFNRINIGSLVISRHLGYNYEGSTNKNHYINLDGDDVYVPEEHDYTSAVIDGQQRMTTIWKFYTNQFKYRGRYFEELNMHDQFNFTNSQISLREFDNDSVPYKDVLRIFILVNRGVPQDEEHLNEIIKQWKEIE